MVDLAQWQVQPILDLPQWFVQAVSQQASGLPGYHAAQLLWQRGIREPELLAGFLNPDLYNATSPFEFGQEMYWAVERLNQAQQNSEKVAIWGDFDADGITATAVLWEGLSQFFPQGQQLIYFIPNRLTESHGLSIQGIEALAAQNCRLIITCDTGSTNLEQLTHSHQLGIDVIVTDHHTLPAERPQVTAIINPRYLPINHPLANLSGVAVAYKLIEAVYQASPGPAKAPLTDLLDLVAIGLIADLVRLTGDCRYLAQRGIEQLQQNQSSNSHTAPKRPGVARLLELCKRSGDRPTDISFGLGPRINAISRIHGDARFCVELLTSQDTAYCRRLAEETELANTRRKLLQKEVVQQIKDRLGQLDLSTTSIIVLADSQWSVGILGLVAGQIAQEYHRPTILLSIEAPWKQESGAAVHETIVGTNQSSLQPTNVSSAPSVSTLIQNSELNTSAHLTARGSARSYNSIDLYQLVKDQSHLLYSFGGHPLALGLSLSSENISLFTEAINRQLREQQKGGTLPPAEISADLTVTVTELGKELFRELKLLEPYGIGNPVPRLLIQNCWFDNVWNRNIQDWQGRKVRYIKTEFEVWDDSAQLGFPGIWWDHYRDEIPQGRCDAIAELDFNTYKKRYEIRLLAVRSREQHDRIFSQIPVAAVDWIVDWRNDIQKQSASPTEGILQVNYCPSSWNELQTWYRRAAQTGQKLAIAYPSPSTDSPTTIWQSLVGIAKYLSRTRKTATRLQLYEKLGIGDHSLQVGFNSLKLLGFEITSSDEGFCFDWTSQSKTVAVDAEIEKTLSHHQRSTIAQFQNVVQEELFRRHYFYKVSLATIQAVAHQTIYVNSTHTLSSDQTSA
jgi:single-stranded-DNA-specific exonuclease